MKDTAYRDLAKEIDILFQEDRSELAVAFVDTLIAAGDLDDIDRWRRSGGENGADSARALLSRRIDTAPLPGGGMSAVFAIPVFGRPSVYDAEAVGRHLVDAWGPGLISLAVDRSYRGIEGLPDTPADRIRLARICAEKGPAAALSSLPKARKRAKRAWDPCLIVCAATTQHARNAFDTGHNVVLDSQTAKQAGAWANAARSSWAGHNSDVGLPDLLGSAIETSRMQSVLKQILVVAGWAGGGLLDILRQPDGCLLLSSQHAGTHRIEGGGFLTDRRILETAKASGAWVTMRNSISVVRSH